MTWESKPLGEILHQSGHDRAGGQDLPVLSITMKHGLIDQADKFKKRVASSDTSNYRIAYKNELVVGFPIDEGVLGFQTKYPAGIVSPAYEIWKLKSEAECHIPYLERYLRSPQARSRYASRMQGAVARRRSLTKADFLNLEIPFPPLDDQIRIADLLAKVEGLIAQRKQHLQQLEDLLKSAFLEMFGDPVRNERGWDKPDLKTFGRLSTGNTPPRSDPSNYDQDFIEWVKTDNITGDAIYVTPAAEYLSKAGASRSRIVPAGTLLVACIAGSVESIGRAALTDRTVAFNQQINAIQPANDVDSLYLYGLFKLSKAYIQSHATKGMKKILTKGDFEKIAMIKPPLENQRDFAAVAQVIEGIKIRYRGSLTDLQDLYGALIQKTFKGEVDFSRIPPRAGLERPALTELSPTPAAASAPSEVLPQQVQSTEPQGKGELLAAWLRAYLASKSPDAILGSAQLLEGAWKALQTERLKEDADASALSLAEYDSLKDLIFKELDSGGLRQTFDDDRNRVALQRQPADWGTW